MRPIILASASPRREMLLRQLIGDTFTIEVSDYGEGGSPGGIMGGSGDGKSGVRSDDDKPGMESDDDGDTDIVTQVLRHSSGKARSVALRHSDGIVIGADTVVICNGKVYGKPHTSEKASEMLKEIGGKVVEVMTGVTVIDVGNGGDDDPDRLQTDQERELQTHEITRVFMKDFGNQTIQDYVSTGEPLDKAGAFGIQGKGAALVSRIEGDYCNVVGLPLYALSGLLKKVGVDALTRS